MQAHWLEVLIEEVKAMINAEEIARSTPRLEALIFGPGSYFASQRVSSGAARGVFDSYPGDVIDAKEAREIELVQAVVPADRLYDEATALAEKISGYSPLAINLGLDAFYNTEEMDLLKSLDYLNTLRVVSFLSEDLQEGARAFIDKRSPEFTGR